MYQISFTVPQAMEDISCPDFNLRVKIKVQGFVLTFTSNFEFYYLDCVPTVIYKEKTTLQGKFPDIFIEIRPQIGQHVFFYLFSRHFKQQLK